MKFYASRNFVVTLCSVSAILSLTACSSVNHALMSDGAVESAASIQGVASQNYAVATQNPDYAVATQNPVVLPVFVNETNTVVPTRNMNFSLSIVGQYVTTANLSVTSAPLYTTISVKIATQPSTNYALSLLTTTSGGTILSSMVIPMGSGNRSIKLPRGNAGTVYKYMLKLVTTKNGVSSTTYSANDVKVTYTQL
ncbi:hypothetical protein EB093_08630 [bacterium]|nr:hypothetical protein [bacterium]